MYDRKIDGELGSVMDHMEKINRWQEFAKSRGWNRVVYPAPHEWLVNKMTGKKCSPSFFWPLWSLGMLSGAFWGIFWGFFMYFAVWRDRTFQEIAVPSILGGFLFGLGTAIFHWYQKRKLKLTTWQEFIEKHGNPHGRA